MESSPLHVADILDATCTVAVFHSKTSSQSFTLEKALLVWSLGGKLRHMAEIICSFTHAVCTTARKGDFHGGVHSLSVSPLLYFLYHTPRLHGRVGAALLSTDVKWNQEVWKATLARLQQVHSLRCTEPRDWNDLFNDLVEVEDKPILGDGPAGTLCGDHAAGGDFHAGFSFGCAGSAWKIHAESSSNGSSWPASLST